MHFYRPKKWKNKKCKGGNRGKKYRSVGIVEVKEQTIEETPMTEEQMLIVPEEKKASDHIAAATMSV